MIAYSVELRKTLIKAGGLKKRSHLGLRQGIYFNNNWIKHIKDRIHKQLLIILREINPVMWFQLIRREVNLKARTIPQSKDSQLNWNKMKKNLSRGLKVSKLKRKQYKINVSMK